jgi:hypothetical protein
LATIASQCWQDFRYAYTWVLPAMGGSTGSEIVHGNEVSSNCFRAMAIQPALGRFLREEDYRNLHPPNTSVFA